MFFFRVLLRQWADADEGVADSPRLSGWIVFPLVVVILFGLGTPAWITLR
jgi:hypothetical protein